MSLFDRLKSLPWAGAARALAVSTLLTLWTVEALPVNPLDEKLFESARFEHAVGQLQRVLGVVGLSFSSEALEQQLTAISEALRDGRKALLAPVMPVYQFAGMQQRWALFRTGASHGCRMQIEGRSADGSWKLLYRAHDTDLYGLRPLLSYRRMRGIYDGCSKDKPPAHYDAFSEWIARKLMDEHREFGSVRVSLQRIRLGSPTAAPQVVGVQHERRHERAL